MEALNNLDLSVVQVWVAFVLTLMVFSYIFGDNPLFRLAEHIFVGTAAGYVTVLIYHTVFRPRLLEPLAQDPAGHVYLLVPLLLGLLLLAKGKRSTSWMGNISMAWLFGVGAALAMGGALLGTLASQLRSSWVSLNPTDYAGRPLGLINALLLALGTIGVLLYFYYTEPAGKGAGRLLAGIRKGWGRLGRWFMLVTFGALFASAIIARFTLLVDRLHFLLQTIGLLGG